MNPLREYMANAKATKHLQPRFYLLTTALGLVAVAAGLAVWYVCFGLVAELAGIPMDTPANEGSGAVWMAAWLFLGIPLCLYFAGALIAGLLGALMAARGKITIHEAVWYALLSRYPQSWFKAAGDA